jgi:DNA-binding response OmpR family regulator
MAVYLCLFRFKRRHPYRIDTLALFTVGFVGIQMPKILVIGAIESQATALHRALRDSGCDLSFLNSDGKVARPLKERPDLVILDATVTELDVPALTQWLRDRFTDLPLMALTAEGVKLARELKLNMHLAQPFTTRKLGNRIKKLLTSRRDQPLTVGVFTLDPEKRRLIQGPRVVRLTPKEYRLLEVLMLNAGAVLSRKQIMKEVWETDYLGDTRTLDVHIRWVREKIEVEPAQPVYLRTIRRIGYVFDPLAVDDGPMAPDRSDSRNRT